MPFVDDCYLVMAYFAITPKELLSLSNDEIKELAYLIRIMPI